MSEKILDTEEIKRTLNDASKEDKEMARCLQSLLTTEDPSRKWEFHHGFLLADQCAQNEIDQLTEENRRLKKLIEEMSKEMSQ